MPDRFLYLAVDLFSFIVPFLFSFERKWIHFIGKWKYIVAGLITMSLFFVTWDILFTQWKVWGFNERYITGIKAAGLPLEEYLFFLLIGFCCMFLYACMNHIFKSRIHHWAGKWFDRIFLAIALVDLGVAGVNYSKLYTLAALGLNAISILLILAFCNWFSWKKFLVGYVFSFIPFTIVNGILTGGYTAEPVVWYNDLENLGLRLDTIPIEDSQYMMLMMIISIFVYEWCQNKLLLKSKP